MTTTTTTCTETPETRRGRTSMIALGGFAVALVIGIVIATADGHAGLWGLVPIGLYALLALLGVDVVLATLAVYGIVEKATYSYALIVMVITAAATGLAGGLTPRRVLEAVYAGASRLIWLFVLFWMLDPMLVLIGRTGAFDTVFADLKPVLSHVGPWPFLMLVVFLGYAHAVPGAAVAQVVLVNRLFGPVAMAFGIPPGVWAVALLGTSQIDQLGPLPGADMIGQMGLARSGSLRLMLFNGWAIITANTVLFAILFWALT
jgi:GntP family gluconate:H+ symporter